MRGIFIIYYLWNGFQRTYVEFNRTFDLQFPFQLNATDFLKLYIFLKNRANIINVPEQGLINQKGG